MRSWLFANHTICGSFTCGFVMARTKLPFLAKPCSDRLIHNFTTTVWIIGLKSGSVKRPLRNVGVVLGDAFLREREGECGRCAQTRRTGLEAD